MDMLLVSNILLWVALMVMAVLLLALTRQVGILHERVAPAGALAINQKLEVGQEAPSMTLQTLDAKLVDVGHPPGAGQSQGQAGEQPQKSQLIFWISPDCPVCKTLLPALKSAARAESAWIDLILASDGADLDHNGYVSRHGLGHWPYVVSELLGKTYGVAKLPYAVLVDEAGKVASMGIVNTREHLESLFEAKERKVASIQDYMNRQRGKTPTTDFDEVKQP